MRYQLKQRIMGFGEDFYVWDEGGNKVFFIDGYAASFAPKFVMKTMQKQKVATIKKKLFKFFPTYSVDLGSGEPTIVRKKPFTIRNTFIIDVPGPNDYTVVGKLIEHEYTFYQNKKEVAKVSKKFFRATDTYSLDIHTSGNEVLLIACSVAIDMICHSKKSKYNR